MVNILCKTNDTLRLGELQEFQGDLKKRTKKDISELIESLKINGLIMPFVVWQSESGNNLLDGHGRLAALTELSLVDNEVATQYFPVLYIDAEDVDTAKKLLLQITSQYGKITRQGAINFCKTIPEYKAPAINKFVHRKPVERKLLNTNNRVIIKISVPADKAEATLNLFRDTEFIEVLK